MFPRLLLDTISLPLHTLSLGQPLSTPWRGLSNLQVQPLVTAIADSSQKAAPALKPSVAPRSCQKRNKLTNCSPRHSGLNSTHLHFSPPNQRPSSGPALGSIPLFCCPFSRNPSLPPLCQAALTPWSKAQTLPQKSFQTPSPLMGGSPTSADSMENLFQEALPKATSVPALTLLLPWVTRGLDTGSQGKCPIYGEVSSAAK